MGNREKRIRDRSGEEVLLVAGVVMLDAIVDVGRPIVEQGYDFAAKIGALSDDQLPIEEGDDEQNGDSTQNPVQLIAPKLLGRPYRSPTAPRLDDDFRRWVVLSGR